MAHRDFYKKILDEANLQFRLQRAIKEIDLDTLSQLYYKCGHKYRGYELHTIEEKYLSGTCCLVFIENFEQFVNAFKIHNYRIM